MHSRFSRVKMYQPVFKDVYLNLLVAWPCSEALTSWEYQNVEGVTCLLRLGTAQVVKVLGISRANSLKQDPGLHQSAGILSTVTDLLTPPRDNVMVSEIKICSLLPEITLWFLR